MEQATAPRATTPGTPWLSAGTGLGAASGGLVGALIGAVDHAWGSVLVGAWLGALSGAPVGLGVGVLMALLVGDRLSTGQARWRAFGLGLVLPPLVLAVLVAPFLGLPITAVLMVPAALLGGPLAAWTAGWRRADRAAS